MKEAITNHYRKHFVENLESVEFEFCEGVVNQTAGKIYKSIEELGLRARQNLTINDQEGHNKHYYVLRFKKELEYGPTLKLKIAVQSSCVNLERYILNELKKEDQ